MSNTHRGLVKPLLRIWYCRYYACKVVYCAVDNCSNGSAIRWSMHSFPISKTRLSNRLRNMNRAQLKPTCHSKLWGKYFEERMFVISPSLARSIGYDMNTVRITENPILIIFVKKLNAKRKRISNMKDRLKWKQ